MKTKRIKKVKNSLGLLALLVPLSLAGMQAHSQQSKAECVVMPIGVDYQYSYTVYNTSSPNGNLIIDFELPIFASSDALSIFDPVGWTHEVIAPTATSLYYNNVNGYFGNYKWNYHHQNDPNAAIYEKSYVFDTPPLIIHWHSNIFNSSGSAYPSNPIYGGTSLSGFRIMSHFNSVKAPSESSWYYFPSTINALPSAGLEVKIPRSTAYNNSGVLGDTNGDGCVNDTDLLNVINDFLSTPNVHGHSDLNNDGVVDDTDLLVVVNHFLSGC